MYGDLLVYANKTKIFSDIISHHIIKSWLKYAGNFIISVCICHSGQMLTKCTICVPLGKLTSDAIGLDFSICLHNNPGHTKLSPRVP